MRPHGRRMRFFIALGLGTLAFIVAGIFIKAKLLEWTWISKLDSPKRADRIAAAEALAALRSHAALPKLIAKLSTCDPKEAFSHRDEGHYYVGAIARLGSSGLRTMFLDL